MASVIWWTIDEYGVDGLRSHVGIICVQNVPDTGYTVVLLGAGVAALAFARRRLG